MFINNSNEKLFNDFSIEFKDLLIALGYKPNTRIQIYTFHQYQQLDNVPDLEFSNFDTFAYVAEKVDSNNPEKDFYAIVYSPLNIKKLRFSPPECYAAIAHEIGHIINFNNSAIPKEGWFTEMRADEVACDVGLKKQLIAVLNKIQEVTDLSETQKRALDLRLRFLNIEQ